MIGITVEIWPYVRPFHITGQTWVEAPVVVITIKDGSFHARGEAFGVYYKGETAHSLAADFEQLGLDLVGLSRGALIERLPAGGLRNALDCALWDLEAKQGNTPAWRAAGLDPPRPLTTTITLGAEEPGDMLRSLRERRDANSLKLKLTGDDADIARVRLARRERPDAWIGVDANQAYDREGLGKIMDVLAEAKIAMLEQPFPVGKEAWLDRLQSPIPIAADESVCDIADLDRVEGRVDYVNIKLDKCGGLTRAFALAAEARRRGFKLMVGNMAGRPWPWLRPSCWRRSATWPISTGRPCSGRIGRRAFATVRAQSGAHPRCGGLQLRRAPPIVRNGPG